MRTTQLPVFRSMYDLNYMLIKLVNKFPKQYKYNIGNELIGVTLQLFKHLFRANRFHDDVYKRTESLNNFLDDFDLLKVLIRLSNEEHLYSLKDAANLARITESISKQITGWRNKSISIEKQSNTEKSEI